MSEVLSPKIGCERDCKICKTKYQRSVLLFDQHISCNGINVPIGEHWKNLSETSKNHIASGIIYFEQKKAEEFCQYCDLFLEATDLGMFLKCEFCKNFGKDGIPFESLSPQAYAVVRRFLITIKIVPEGNQEIVKEQNYVRFCATAAAGIVSQEEIEIWQTISEDCSCKFSYKLHNQKAPCSA